MEERLRYERLLQSSPSYRAAPPVRADGTYDSALEKWKISGGDASKLAIESVSLGQERTQTDIPIKAQTERPTSSVPLTAADFIAAVKLSRDLASPKVSVPESNIIANRRGEDLPRKDSSLYRDFVVSPSQFAPRFAQGNTARQPSAHPFALEADRQRGPSAAPSVSFDAPVRLQSKSALTESEIFREPPPLPQRPYTVEWIVNTPQRTRLNPNTGAIEDETLTPVPEFRGESGRSLHSSPVAMEVSPPPRPAARSMDMYYHEQPFRRSRSRREGSRTHRDEFERERVSEERGEEERMAMIAGGTGDPMSVAQILLMLDEFDERKLVKQACRLELVRLHKQHVLDRDDVARRERPSRSQLALAFRQTFEELAASEEHNRRSLITEAISTANALLAMEERLVTADLRELKNNTTQRRWLVEEENFHRLDIRNAEDDERNRIGHNFLLSEGESARRVQSRIARRLREVREGDPVEQRQQIEDEEELHRFESVEAVEVSERQHLYVALWAVRPMLYEDLRSRSLGFSDDLFHDDLRVHEEDDLLSSMPPTTDEASELESYVSDGASDVHMDRISRTVMPLGEECEQYLHEKYQASLLRARRAQSGYNRNGWRYTAEQPDPLLFVGVRDDRGKLLGSSAPAFKSAVRQFLMPGSRQMQRGDSTLTPDGSMGAPPVAHLSENVVMLKHPEEPIHQITKADEEDMQNILRNIRRTKTFTWPRHYASVRDRPAFPQDSEWDIYRREPGPNMGNSKRYHDVIDERYGQSL